jgi:hypothetical protein
MIHFNCTCGRELQSPDDLAGHPGRCPSCGEVRTVPRRPASCALETLEPASVGGSVRGFTLTASPPKRPLPESGASRGGAGELDLAAKVFYAALIVGLIALSIWMVTPRTCGLRIPPSAEAESKLTCLGLAIVNCAAGEGEFPPAGGGKKMHPGLSWRVALLPYLGYDVLYSQFHLDEPWDSPRNIQLLVQMPNDFIIPGSNDPSGMTRYRVFVGKGTAFEVSEPGAKVRPGLRVQNMPEWKDKILVIKAADAVPWTKPDELDYKPDGPLPRLSTVTGGPRALMGDGSVRDLVPDTPDEVLRALIAR